MAGGADYGTTVSNLVRSIWDKADEKNQKLWPNPMPAENSVPPAAVFNYNYVFGATLAMRTTGVFLQETTILTALST